MNELRFWLGMLHRAGLKRNDKLLVGNIDTEEPNYIDISELLAVLTTDDLPESDTKKYISPQQLQKLNDLAQANYTLLQLAEYFYPLNGNPSGYLTATSALDASKLIGAIAAALIPALDAGKITTGIFGAARIPDLPASKITSGTFHVDRIPLLPVTKFEGIALELGKYILKTAIGAANGVAPLDANAQLLPGYIANLDASKITSGIFAEARIPDIYVKLAQLVDYYSKAETQAFTIGEKEKLAGLESPKWKGGFLTPAALRTAFPEGEAAEWHEGIGGWTADVDAGVGQLNFKYYWDASDYVWREGTGGGGSDTAATVKLKYESNEDTNAFTDDLKGKVEALPAIVESTTGAQAKADAAKIAAQNYSDLRADGLEGRILLNENNKVDKVPGETLTPEKFTLAEKQKLAAVEDAKWKGQYPTKAALIVDYPEGTGQVWHQDKGGWKGDVDAGPGADVVTYLWDSSDLKWVLQTGSTTAETAASVRSKYLSNVGTEELTTTLKGYYDTAYNWVNTNGANIIAHIQKWVTPTVAGKMPRTLEGGGIEWIDTPSGGGGAGDMVLADTQTVSGLKTFLHNAFGLRNVANTFTSFFTNSNTANRTYTLQNRNGTLADLTDLNGKMNNPTGGVANYLPKFLTATTMGISRILDTGTFLGIGTVNAPTKDITLNNESNKEIGIELSVSSTKGRDLIVSAGKTVNYLLNTDLNQVTDVLNGWVGMTAAPNNDIYVTTRIGTIYKQTNSEGAFLTFGQANRQWRGMTAAPNGDIYAVTLNGDIYKRTAGAGDFLALGQTSRSWHDIATAANGDIYATVRGGDIYKQTNGTGDFIGIGEVSRQWRGITVAPNGDIYATVSGGDVYKQVGGVGAFSGLGQTATIWNFIQAAPNGNIYASRSADSQTEDIYVQIGGLGNFQPIGQPARRYHGLAVNSLGDLYAAEGGDTGYTGYIYKQINNAAGLADLDGGALIHKAGTGKGTGKSRLEFYTGQKTASGTDMQIETLRAYIDENGYLVHLFTPVFADNAAAIAGGLPVGAFYRTASGILMIVY